MTSIAENIDLSFPDFDEMISNCESLCISKDYDYEVDATVYEFEDGSCLSVDAYQVVKTYFTSTFF
jgi:hypothetical protein